MTAGAAALGVHIAVEDVQIGAVDPDEGRRELDLPRTRRLGHGRAGVQRAGGNIPDRERAGHDAVRVPSVRTPIVRSRFA
jgi:hypothetical protein